MLKQVSAVAAILVVSGCQSSDPKVLAVDPISECKAYGFAEGSSAMAYCRMGVERRQRQEAEAAAQSIAQSTAQTTAQSIGPALIVVADQTPQLPQPVVPPPPPN
jgi:hypothetical protein